MTINTLSPQACGDTTSNARCDATLPDNPQCTLNYHFGMLLGVDDFQAEQGFHLGRSRRHQRLLHGVGVVAGFQVSFDETTFDLRITPGLAVDALGRDLALDVDQCVNLVKWWQAHQSDAAFDDIKTPKDATFDLDVVACYSTCLSSPVPAIAEPCAGLGGASGAADVAYSRLCETVTLQLRRRIPSEAKAPKPTPWPATHQGLADLLSRQDITPPDPADPAELCVTLGCLRGLHLKQDAKGWRATIEQIDLQVRPLLLATQTLQDLLLGALSNPDVQGGPVALPGSAKVLGVQVSLAFDHHLAAASVQAGAFAVSEFDTSTGWHTRTVLSAAYADVAPQAPTVALTLDQAPTGQLVRITVIGTGSTPLLGQNLIPAGAPRSDCDGRSLTTTIQ
jgi:hypothetical protein